MRKFIFPWEICDKTVIGCSGKTVGNNCRKSMGKNDWFMWKMDAKNVGNQWENVCRKSVVKKPLIHMKNGCKKSGKSVGKCLWESCGKLKLWIIREKKVNARWENQWENIYPQGFYTRNDLVWNPWKRALTHWVSHGFYRGKNQFV